MSFLGKYYDRAKPYDYEEVPDGNYQVRIDSIKQGETKQAGHDMISWDFVVIAGKHKGSHIFKYDVFDESRGEEALVQKMCFLKTDLKICGATNFGSFLSLPDVFSEILDAIVEIRIKTSIGKTGKEYTNINIKRKLDGVSAVQATVTNDDIPF